MNSPSTHAEASAIKQQFVALFSPTPPPATPKKVVECLVKFKGDKPTEATAIKPTITNRNPNTIFISSKMYSEIAELRDLDSLPIVVYNIIRELDDARKTADLGKVFDAIKPHVALFKESLGGIYILRAMILNNYFVEEANQGFLRSFFHDIGKDRLREIVKTLCAVRGHSDEVIIILTTLCGYTKEEIEALLQ